MEYCLKFSFISNRYFKIKRKIKITIHTLKKKNKNKINLSTYNSTENIHNTVHSTDIHF